MNRDTPNAALDERRPDPTSLGLAYAVEGLVPADDAALIALVAGTTPRLPSPSDALRRQILAQLSLSGRYDRFVPPVVELFDVAADEALALLDSLDVRDDWADGPLPGTRELWIDGGPGVAGTIRGFLRMHAGAHFPAHTHLGEERVYVMQGSLEDSVTHEVTRAGEMTVMAVGSRHGFSVTPGGPDLLAIVVLRRGLRLDDGAERLAPAHEAP